MVLPLSSQWGPYRDAFEARTCLARFVDKVCGPGVGIVWTADGDIYALRAPRHDSENFGDTVVFQWLPAAAIVSHKPLGGFWDQVEEFVKGALAAEGNALNVQGQAQIAVGRPVDRVIGRMATSHRDDGVGVALDVVCVGLSLALVPIGLGTVALFGLIGGVVLLGTDSYAYALEVLDRNEDADKFKLQSEKLRLLATIAALPDAVWGGLKAIREINEVRELRALDRTTAVSAEALATRTANASRAKEYAQIEERAQLRSQLRTQQITASLKHEIIPRGAGLGSAMLLLKEELLSDDSTLRLFLSRLQIHCVAAHS